MPYQPRLHTGYSNAHKPAHNFSEIQTIEKGLEKMWTKNKKLYNLAATKEVKRKKNSGYLLDLKEEVLEMNK